MRRGEGSGWERRRRPLPRTAVEVGDELALPAPADEVFERLLDIDTVALCLPGMVHGSLRSDDENTVSTTVRQMALGVTATWQLSMTMRPDVATRTLRIGLDGMEPRLGMKLIGTADVAVAETVAETAAETTILRYTGRVEVEGRLAATGAPIINRLIEETLRRFVGALGAPAEAQPAGGGEGRLARLGSWVLARCRTIWRARAS